MRRGGGASRGCPSRQVRSRPSRRTVGHRPNRRPRPGCPSRFWRHRRSRCALLEDWAELSMGLKPSGGPESPALPRRMPSIWRSAPPMRWLATSCHLPLGTGAGQGQLLRRERVHPPLMPETRDFTSSICDSTLVITHILTSFLSGTSGLFMTCLALGGKPADGQGLPLSESGTVAAESAFVVESAKSCRAGLNRP